MPNKTINFLKGLPTSIFYTVINPALIMGLGFLFISGSIRAEQLSKWTGIELFSLYGVLNYDTALQFSAWFHGSLNEYNLIPILFFSGMGVIMFQRYRKLRFIQFRKKRLEKALILGLFESIFLSVILFGGSIGNIHALFPDAISNTLFVLGIIIPGMYLSVFRKKLAENLHIFIESKRNLAFDKK